MKYIILLVLFVSCKGEGQIIQNRFVTIPPFKEYGDVYLKNYEDSCLLIKTHPHHNGICGLTAWSVYDSCGRKIAYGCTDSKVLDTIYNRCKPCDSLCYKYVFKERNIEKWFHATYDTTNHN